MLKDAFVNGFKSSIATWIYVVLLLNPTWNRQAAFAWYHTSKWAAYGPK